jgi:hypothetical protein
MKDYFHNRDENYKDDDLKLPKYVIPKRVIGRERFGADKPSQGFALS